MKRFALYLLSITAFLIAFLYFLNILYTYTFNNGVARSKIQYILQQKNVSYDYVFFGSSRSECHIDCALVEELTGKSCLNLGISGSTLQDALVLIELMNAQDIEIKNAFVQVDYMYNTTGFSSNFKARLLPFSNDVKINKFLVGDDKSLANEYLPFYRYLKNDHVIGFREVFNLLIGKKALVDFDNGFRPILGNSVLRNQSLPETIITTNPSIEAMELIFKEKEMNFYFFVAPICSSVVHNGYINKLKTKIPNLHNYRSVYDGRQALFFDCGHLNARGAQEFTRLLTNDLILKPIR